MNSFLQSIKSSPNSIKNNPNYLKNYINAQRFTYSTTCLDLILKGNKKNFQKYVQKIGDYNFKKSSDPKWIPEHTENVADYSQYCPAGWTQKGTGCYAPDSYSGPCNSGKSSCQLRILGDCLIGNDQPPSYFTGYSDQNKKDWAQGCGADWPQVSRKVPGAYQCQYGASIGDDIAQGSVIKIGTVSGGDYIEATKIAILNSKGIRPNFFAMVGNDVYLASNGSDAPFTEKGTYETNCDNGGRVQLYQLDSKIFQLLDACKSLNNNLNSANDGVTKLAGSQFDIYKKVVADKIKTDPDWVNNHKNEIYKNTTQKIENNLNEIIKNLSSNYNKKAEIYNTQSEIINKHQDLVEIGNEKLNKQLNAMSDIANDIATKTRIIELNEESVKKALLTKRLLIGFIILLPLLVIPILMILFGIVTSYIGGGIIFAMIFGYIIYMVIMINKHKVKQFLKPTMKQISKYEKAVSKYYEKEKDELSKELSEFVYGECDCPPEEAEEGDHKRYDKGDYMLKANGPFYYYDGSAPPQQIAPKAMGSIDFAIGDKILTFPKEISQKLDQIKNPIQRLFFEMWLRMLQKKGISVDDPRFIKKLDVIDLQNVNESVPPYWAHIKLPMVSDFQQNVSNVCQKYNEIRTQSGSNAGAFLVDTWDYFLDEMIPEKTYQNWLKKINDAVSHQKDIKKVYQDFISYITNSSEFKKKYPTMDSFLNAKLADFVTVFNSRVAFAEPTVTKIRDFQ